MVFLTLLSVKAQSVKITLSLLQKYNPGRYGSENDIGILYFFGLFIQSSHKVNYSDFQEFVTYINT